MSHYLAMVVLLVSVCICVYLLAMLWRIHHVHRSSAWKFIFMGLALLGVECIIGTHLAYVHVHSLSNEEVLFIAIIMCKAICYAIGFTIWRHDLKWLVTLAKRRRLEMQDDEKDRPQPPARPTPPTQPAPGGPPIRPTDDPVPPPPGDPQGPGKGGGG